MSSERSMNRREAIRLGAGAAAFGAVAAVGIAWVGDAPLRAAVARVVTRLRRSLPHR